MDDGCSSIIYLVIILSIFCFVFFYFNRTIEGLKIGKKMKKAGKSISKGAKKAGKGIEKGAKETGKAIQKGADAVVDTAEEIWEQAKILEELGKLFGKVIKLQNIFRKINI